MAKEQRKNYEIKQITKDLFEVRNLVSGVVYKVDLALNKCECVGWMYWHKCVHLTLCKGVKETK